MESERKLERRCSSEDDSRLEVWWSRRLRCCRVSALGLDSEDRECGVKTPGMKEHESHFNCLLFDRKSSNSCWILREEREIVENH